MPAFFFLFSSPPPLSLSLPPPFFLCVCVQCARVCPHTNDCTLVSAASKKKEQVSGLVTAAAHTQMYTRPLLRSICAAAYSPRTQSTPRTAHAHTHLIHIDCKHCCPNPNTLPARPPPLIHRPSPQCNSPTTTHPTQIKTALYTVLDNPDKRRFKLDPSNGSLEILD